MSLKNSNIRAVEYSRLRTRWFLVALIVQALALVVLAFLTVGMIESDQVTYDEFDFFKFSAIWLFLACLPVWLGCVVVYLAVIIPVEYHLEYDLRRRFGLSGGVPSRALNRVAGLVLSQVFGGIFLTALILWLRVYTENYWAVILVAVLAAWFFVRLRLPQKANRFLGYDIIRADADERFDDLRRFAADNGIENLQLNLMSAASSVEVRAVCLRRRSQFAVYMTDNLPELLSAAELKAVFAHELGHFRGGRGIFWFRLIIWFATVVLAGVVPFLGESPGVTAVQAVQAAPMVMLVMYLSLLLTRPILLLLSRRNELAANALAIEMTGDVEAFMSAMRKLADNNLIAGQPGIIEKLFIQTHPSLDEISQATGTTNHKEHKDHEDHKEKLK